MAKIFALFFIISPILALSGDLFLNTKDGSAVEHPIQPPQPCPPLLIPMSHVSIDTQATIVKRPPSSQIDRSYVIYGSKETTVCDTGFFGGESRSAVAIEKIPYSSLSSSPREKTIQIALIKMKAGTMDSSERVTTGDEEYHCSWPTKNTKTFEMAIMDPQITTWSATGNPLANHKGKCNLFSSSGTCELPNGMILIYRPQSKEQLCTVIEEQKLSCKITLENPTEWKVSCTNPSLIVNIPYYNETIKSSCETSVGYIVDSREGITHFIFPNCHRTPSNNLKSY